MKIVVAGFGRAGCNIADKFVDLQGLIKKERGLKIVVDAFAFNTARIDLSALSHIQDDDSHRITMGEEITWGGGVGKINKIGAEIAKKEIETICDPIAKTMKDFYDEVDAVLLIASTGGGTGSGAISVVAQELKKRYSGKKKRIYVMLILPFGFEEKKEQWVINSAVCIRSVLEEARPDAVFLVDNERYIKQLGYAEKGASSRTKTSLSDMLEAINDLIVKSFADILCAGEEEKRQNIGRLAIDTGEPRETFEGLTAFGWSYEELSRPSLFSRRKKDDSRRKSRGVLKAIGYLEGALSELSLECLPSEASNILYIIRAPADEINEKMVEKMENYLKEQAPDARWIRGGDYPRDEGVISVTVVLSGLTEVKRIKHLYSRALVYMEEEKEREKQRQDKRKEIEEAGKDVPSLI